MTPKEKAEELVKKHVQWTPAEEEYEYPFAKESALITVNELINAFKELSIEDSGTVFRDFGHGYWEEVKVEIEKL